MAPPSPQVRKRRSGDPALVLVRGAGDIATGVGHCFRRAGFRVLMTETAHPTVVRRSVSFAEAVFEGVSEVEGVTARLTSTIREAEAVLAEGEVALMIDPTARTARGLEPSVLVDAIMAKANLGTSLTDAPLVIGVGPGFEAGTDVDAVVETQRGHDLGRIIVQGSAQANTSVPGDIGGYTTERLLKSPSQGVFMATSRIGDSVSAGDAVGHVDGAPVIAAVSGVLRGVIRDGLTVRQGQKLGDVDPRGVASFCFTVSDKARTVAAGALIAALWLGDTGVLSNGTLAS
jgi:xanthine dehydrogenase accessory factor